MPSTSDTPHRPKYPGICGPFDGTVDAWIARLMRPGTTTLRRFLDGYKLVGFPYLDSPNGRRILAALEAEGVEV